MTFLGIIPARYYSTRLQGKPLAYIGGKPMVQHVYERVNRTLETVVATDDTRIRDAVRDFGGRVVMTDKNHSNGTSRCLEAVRLISEQTGKVYTHIINIQGDEPLIATEQLQELMRCFDDTVVSLATLVKKVTQHKDLNYDNTSSCFVVVNRQDEAMYFSRFAIPYVRGLPKTQWLNRYTFYKHIGLYGYTYEALCDFCAMPTSSLEMAESLEQNRWLQAGRKIHVGYTDHETFSVDTPDDLEHIRQHIAQNGII